MTNQRNTEADSFASGHGFGVFSGHADDSIFARTVSMTPLHLSVAVESKVNRWIEWNGFTTAEVLTSINEEYQALRGAAVMIDRSPLKKYRLSGSEVEVLANRLVTDDLSSLLSDQSLHSFMCDHSGYVIGDVWVLRREDQYYILTEEAHLAWLLYNASLFNVRVEDASDEYALISLWGPASSLVLQAAGLEIISGLSRGEGRRVSVQGMPAYFSRTDLSGDVGYDLWVEPDDAPHIWRILMEKGQPYGLCPAGYALNELARIEAGMPRAGQDYHSPFAGMSVDDMRTPFEFCVKLGMDLSKKPFNGREALRRLSMEKPAKRLVPIMVPSHEPASFVSVHADGKIVGTVTSHVWSPAVGANIGLATIQAHAFDQNLNVHAQMSKAGIREQKLKVHILAEPIFPRPFHSVG